MCLEEKRRSRRLDLDVQVELSRIDDEEGVTTLKLINVEIIDLSKDGIGFKVNQELEIGSFYNTRIQIWTKENIDSVIEIVRRDEYPDTCIYGAKFIGMTDAELAKIEIYQMFYEYEENMKQK